MERQFQSLEHLVDERFQSLDELIDDRFKSLEDLVEDRFQKLEELIDEASKSTQPPKEEEDVQDMNLPIASPRGSGKRSAAMLFSGEGQETPAIKKLETGVAAKSNVLAQDKASTSIQPPHEEEKVEPTEMSLEEIERGIGSHIDSPITTPLNSTVPEERLEGLSSPKQQGQHIQDLEQLVELSIRSLCALTGIGEETNAQVIELIRHLSAGYRFSRKCVELCLPGVCESLSSVKTRDSAKWCLGNFSQAVGYGFVIERLLKILEEHKQPTVLNEGIGWMSGAVFKVGLSEMKMKDLLNFIAKIGVQSSEFRARNASIFLYFFLVRHTSRDIVEGLCSDADIASIRKAIDDWKMSVGQMNFRKTGLNVVKSRISH